MARRRPSSLRLRLAATVGLVAFVVLAGAGSAMVWAVDEWMHATVRSEVLLGLETARVRLLAGESTESVAAVVPGQPMISVGSDERSALPPIVDGPPPDGDSGKDEDFPFALRREALIEMRELEPGSTELRRIDLGGIPGYVAMTAVIDAEGRSVTVASAAPLLETERTVAALRTATVAAVPALALLLAGLAAVVTGRALRPVRDMRTEADAISHGTLHQRLTPAAGSFELAELAGTMNDMLDRLDRAAIRQRQFTADASHELRSPLTTIRATIELALADPGSINESGLTAIGEIDRLDSLVTDLLTLSRLDGDPSATHPEDVDLDDLVREQIGALNGTPLTITTSGVDHVRVHADRRALVSVVRNLLDNAARHAATTVTVSLSSDSNSDNRDNASTVACLTVDDDGPGIPAGDRERVFERFARLDDARARDSGGTGLGLAVAAAIVKAHDGTIIATDSPAGGARLRVTLPSPS